MTVHYEDHGVTLHHGDCLDVLAELPDCSVDSVVTDPPYGLEFMGKDWDKFGRDTGPGYREKPRITNRPSRDGSLSAYTGSAGRGVNSFQAGRPFQDWCQLWTAECLRVLKPGGYLLSFGGSRTWHRLAAAVEDAGFEIRDSIAWLYGSGFPKSLDVSKAIDKAAGAEREVICTRKKLDSYGEQAGNAVHGGGPNHDGMQAITAPATPESEQWSGWGTALKPAFEPIVVARKPLAGTVAANVLAHGTGALNIDASRIGDDERTNAAAGNKPGGASYNMSVVGMPQDAEARTVSGRWPANVILDESQAEALDEQTGELVSGSRNAGTYRGIGYQGSDPTDYPSVNGDSGGASRFFYTAKADQSERITHNGVAHPTVKPLDLMRWLVRLVTQPGGTILEPFAGSGTTIEAALLEGFQVIGIEREADYLPLITQRINRRRDPVAYLGEAGEDLGLFGDGEDGAA